MCDIFSFSRGKILSEGQNFYDRAFPETRSKTAEHNIYERAGKSLVRKNVKPRKSTEIGENER